MLRSRRCTLHLQAALRLASPTDAVWTCVWPQDMEYRRGLEADRRKQEEQEETRRAQVGLPVMFHGLMARWFGGIGLALRNGAACLVTATKARPYRERICVQRVESQSDWVGTATVRRVPPE